jgi:phage gpG-like protein
MIDKIPNFNDVARKLIKDAQTIAEVEMINFIHRNFESQGFMDASLQPWEQRKMGDDGGRAILKGAGALQDEISVSSSSLKQIIVSATSKHARIHNEGGIINIPITKKMRDYFWYRYYGIADKKGNIVNGSPTEASMWKAMALTKKTHLKIKMPKRQFMGPSIAFNNLIEQKFIKMIEMRFKQA